VFAAEEAVDHAELTDCGLTKSVCGRFVPATVVSPSRM